MDAATAAMTASDDADMAADAAEMAVMNLATMQTGGMSKMYAMQARKAADMAMAEYMKAKTASDGANAAGATVTSAVEEKVKAEAAKMTAEGHAGMADEKGTGATQRAAMELMIDGKDKNVGASSLNADDPSHTVTTNDQTVITGLMKSMNAMHNVAMVDGVDFTANAAPAADIAYVQAVAAVDITIGRTLDSSDDMTRLMLITSYAGSKTVKVYAENAGATDVTSIKAGTIQSAGAGTPVTTDDTFVNLKSVGMYYPVDNTGGDADALEGEDVVTATAKPQRCIPTSMAPPPPM